MTEFNDNRFLKEYASSFILEDKYFHQLTTPNQIAVYAFLARNSCSNVRFSEIDFYDFCELMGITEQELKYISNRFYEIGYLIKGNQS